MDSLSGCSEKTGGDRHGVEKSELSYCAGGKVKCRTIVWPLFQNITILDQNLTPYGYAQVK